MLGQEATHLKQVYNMVSVLTLVRIASHIQRLLNSAPADLEKERSLNKFKNVALYMVSLLLCMTSLTHCSENLPTTNPVKPIELDALDGLISDKGYSGLLVAMASWCPPCRDELPILEKLHKKYREKGIQIVAISLDNDGPKEVQPLINKLKISFPVYWVGLKAAQHYKISGVPFTMVYNQGNLTTKLPGSHPKRTLEKIIQRLMADSK